LASILLVDDDPNVEETITAVLRNEGYVVTSHSNLAAALDELGEKRFDLVISEQAFEEPADGLALLVEAQRRSQSGAIVLTSYGSEHAENVAREMGLHHYLRKPCSIELLRHTVQGALEEARPPGQRRISEDARGGLRPTEIEPEGNR
jgi:DNA-binding response OmpR family regulator